MQIIKDNRQITVQHELENPHTDVVEAVVVLADAWLTVSDIKERLVMLNYEVIRTALGKLAGSGRLQVQQMRNERARGPKIVSKYHGRPGQKPRLFV